MAKKKIRRAVKKKARRSAKKTKKKTRPSAVRSSKKGKPGPKPGHGGRPPKMTNPLSRSIMLGADEWGQVEKLAPHGSWSDRVRQLVTMAKGGRKK